MFTAWELIYSQPQHRQSLPLPQLHMPRESILGDMQAPDGLVRDRRTDFNVFTDLNLIARRRILLPMTVALAHRLIFTNPTGPCDGPLISFPLVGQGGYLYENTYRYWGPCHTPARLPGFEPGHPGVKVLCLNRLAIAHHFSAVLHGLSDSESFAQYFLFRALFHALACTTHR